MEERKVKSTKEFMRAFLTEDMWDDWLLVKAQIAGANTWDIDGTINKEYFAGGDETDVPAGTYSRWEQLRPFALSVIRGKRTPLSFMFILQPPAALYAEHTDPGCDRVCRIRFVDGSVMIASAVSMSTFTLDKEPERAWDRDLSAFLDD
ncbi:MAG: DUF5721 family protein, partial [Lachnospiraceae bacterium]|nr:DUF5721 family protein [Lachnospiraceae bacterium]